MKFFRLALVALLLGSFAPLAGAATDRISTHFSSDAVEAPNFEVATDTDIGFDPAAERGRGKRPEHARENRPARGPTRSP